MIKGYHVKSDSVSETAAIDEKKLWSLVQDCQRDGSLAHPCFVNDLRVFDVVVIPEDKKEYYECYSLGAEDENPTLSKYFGDACGIVGDSSVYLARQGNGKYEPVRFDWTLDWFANNFEQCWRGFTEKKKQDESEQEEEEEEEEEQGSDEKKSTANQPEKPESKQPVAPIPLSEVDRVIHAFLDSEQVQSLEPKIQNAQVSHCLFFLGTPNVRAGVPSENGHKSHVR